MAKRKTHLAVALKKDSPLCGLVRDGMGAFTREDMRLIEEGERARIGDSLDLDSASKHEFPQGHCWDYILSAKDSGDIVGIEPHTAKDSEISVVIEKKRRASQYLLNHFHAGFRVARWFWVSHGTVGFSRMDPARRRLDQNGIRFAGRMLRSLD